MRHIITDQQNLNGPHFDENKNSAEASERDLAVPHPPVDERQRLRDRLLRMIRDNEQARRRHERKAK